MFCGLGFLDSRAQLAQRRGYTPGTAVQNRIQMGLYGLQLRLGVRQLGVCGLEFILR